MKVAYITAHTPFGRGETFVLEEMAAMSDHGAELVIVPRNPPKEVFDEHAQQFIECAIWLPIINKKILLLFLKTLAVDPRVWVIISRIFRNSRTLKILVKNLALVPKSFYISELFCKRGIEHIHVHWGSTTSTMAWIASELTNIPWSMTLHRWDIAENNMLKLKVDRAAIVRCISEDGRDEVLRIVGEEFREKVKILHMGVMLPELSSERSPLPRSDFAILCPANFVPKKGHRFLIEACALLVTRGTKNLRCLLTADGPLEEEIRQQIAELGLEKIVHLVGRIPYGKLLDMYKIGEVDVVVLPSIVTSDGEREGIPVALMEAMAYGIPVISTETGGIPELLKDGAGLLVPPESSEKLAEAIAQLMSNRDLRMSLSQKGYERILEDFNLRKNIAILFDMMDKYRRSKRS
ncbi:MAG: glycosyltransferase family 4 protein [Methanothrix sp.]|nr:glycosyltransferase family 4 protein [Methanothrix sp.]